MNSSEFQRAGRLKALLVDDEKLAREFLARMLWKNESIQECVACRSAAEARERIKQFRPDILFLDIEMPEGSGFQLLDMLHSEELPIVVFTTAFAQFASRAFDVQACDYLLKPFDEDRLSLAIDRAKEALRNHSRSARTANKITLPLGDRTVRLAAHEIDWMFAEDNYVRIHCGKENLLVRSTLSKLERDFRSEVLLRVHRSCIVNINRVKEVQRDRNHQYSIILGDGTAVKCSRRYKRRLRMALVSDNRLTVERRLPRGSKPN
jgi:two-component system LytT family response regulator